MCVCVFSVALLSRMKQRLSGLQDGINPTEAKACFLWDRCIPAYGVRVGRAHPKAWPECFCCTKSKYLRVGSF